MARLKTIVTPQPSAEEKEVLNELNRKTISPHELKVVAKLKREGRYQEFVKICLEHQGPPRLLNPYNAFRAAAIAILDPYRSQELVREANRNKRLREIRKGREASALDAVSGSVAGVNFDRDFEWAYLHLGIKTVATSAAPSISAWELLQFARHNRETFFKAFLMWSEKRRKDQQGNDVFQDDRRQKFVLLDKLDDALQRDLTSRLTDWMQTTPTAVIAVLATLGWRCERILATAPIVEHPPEAGSVVPDVNVPVPPPEAMPESVVAVDPAGAADTERD